MSNIIKVLTNLIIYSAVLLAGIIVLSKVFDIGTKRFLALDGKKRKIGGVVLLVLAGLVPVILSKNTYALRTSVLVLIYIVLALS